MEEPTIEEILELVEFDRNAHGCLCVKDVKTIVWGNVCSFVTGNVAGYIGGDVYGSVNGDVKGDVRGNVKGDVKGDVGGGVVGTINGRQWQFVETPKEKAIRLIREGKSEEAIKVLEESEL